MHTFVFCASCIEKMYEIEKNNFKNKCYEETINL